MQIEGCKTREGKPDCHASRFPRKGGSECLVPILFLSLCAFGESNEGVKPDFFSGHLYQILPWNTFSFSLLHVMVEQNAVLKAELDKVNKLYAAALKRLEHYEKLGKK